MSDRTTYAREYARERRRQAWAAAAQDVLECPALLARGKPCRWPLASRFVHGETVPFCAQCDRKARGICIDCQVAPVVGTIGKALRCALCRKLENAAAQDRWRHRHPKKVKQMWRRRKAKLQADPAQYEAMLERKRLWRKANPKKVAKHKAKESRSERAQAYYAEYRAKYRERRREQMREYERRKRAGEITSHPCVRCGTSITGRPKKCAPCKQAEYQQARRVLLGVAA